MGKYENNLRKAVAQFVKARVEVSTLYQYKKGNTWKKADTSKSWSKTAQYRMVTKWRRRNVNIKHENLYVTFQQGKKVVFYKDASYTAKQKDFSIGIEDKGDRRWHPLATVYFKVKGKYGNGTSVWGGFIGSTPQAPVAVPFTARKKDSQVKK